jgi:hypothetical protein
LAMDGLSLDVCPDAETMDGREAVPARSEGRSEHLIVGCGCDLDALFKQAHLY